MFGKLPVLSFYGGGGCGSCGIGNDVMSGRYDDIGDICSTTKTSQQHLLQLWFVWLVVHYCYLPDV